MSKKNYLTELLILLTIFVCSSCEDINHTEKERNKLSDTNENSQFQKKANKELLDTLLTISKESAYKSSELFPIALWNNHHEVAVMICDITTIRDTNFFTPKKDTIKTISTLVFMRSEHGWRFESCFGPVNKDK